MSERTLVGWRVKDYADGWIAFPAGREKEMLELANATGAKFEPIFSVSEYVETAKRSG